VLTTFHRILIDAQRKNTYLGGKKECETRGAVSDYLILSESGWKRGSWAMFHYQPIARTSVSCLPFSVFYALL